MDLFSLFGRVIVETKDAVDSLGEISQEAERTGNSASKVGEGFTKSGKITKKHLEEIAKASKKTADEVKKEAESMAKKYMESGMDSETAMRKAYEDIEKAAKESADGSESAGSKIADSLKKVSKVGAAAVAAIVAIGTAMVEAADGTREYRLEMGKLETAFTNAGHTTIQATETYKTLYSILGETDRSVEAAQHIAKLCDNEAQLAAMTNACIGAFALFDDSLPIESLVEAANETAKTGQLTGALADAINWAGASEAEFQAKLNACNSERERTALIIDTLNGLYGQAAEAYKKNNAEVIAATVAQEELNAATARWGEICEPVVTFFKQGLADAILFAANSFEAMFDPTTATKNALLGVLETSEEAAAKVEELSAKLAEFQAIPEEFRPADYEQNILPYVLALEEAEAKCVELAEAEQKAAEEASGLAEATAESAAKFTEVTDQYIADAKTLFEAFGQTYENIYSKVSNFFKPFEEAKVTVTASINDMMTAMQSQIEFNNAYTANLQTLKDYGLGGLSEAFQSYGANGAAYAQAIVAAVEQAGGATTEAGQQIIQNFADLNQQVTASQEGLSQTMALMDGEFEAQLQSIVNNYESAIEGLNKSSEASAAATSTFGAFLAGMSAQIPAITSQMVSFGQQITASLQSGIGEVSIPVTITTSGSIPGHESGLDYVPFDNYLAYLHKGEAVLTAEEATAWRAGKEVASNGNGRDSGSVGGSVTVNQYIEAVAQTPVELASTTAAYFEQARWIV